MQKNEQSSRQIVMCHLMAIMRIDIEKATWIVGEMEESGLIQFDDMGNVGLLVLEGQSWNVLPQITIKRQSVTISSQNSCLRVIDIRK